MEITSLPLIYGPLDVKVGVKSETRIGNKFYPLENWLKQVGCTLQGVDTQPAIGEGGFNVTIYYKGGQPPDLLADLLSESFDSNIMLCCVQER